MRTKGYRDAVAEYKRLLARQRTLPVDAQWTMGASIRAAIIRCQIEREASEVHGREVK